MMNLGIIVKDGKVVNHRSLLKVLINPFLRTIGWQIASILEDNNIKGISLVGCPKISFKIMWNYDLQGCLLIKRRRII